MTVDGVNIWTWGFFLVTVSGLFNQPARKKTLNETGTDAQDIQHVNKVVTVEIAADYADYAALKTGVAAMLTALKSGEKTFSFVNYSKTVTGYVKDGITTDIPDGKTLVKAKFKITVT